MLIHTEEGTRRVPSPEGHNQLQPQHNQQADSTYHRRPGMRFTSWLNLYPPLRCGRDSETGDCIWVVCGIFSLHGVDDTCQDA